MQIKPFIKICGITDAAIARDAILAGATFVGLIFAEHSPRNISLSQADMIAKSIKDVGGVPVAVFVDQTATLMQNICEQLQIDVVQLHGAVSRSEHHLLPANYQRIYAIEADNNGLVDIVGLEHCQVERDYVLFDNKKNGGAINFNLVQFIHYCSYRFGIAGGLNADNVSRVIKKLSMNPYFIDVSSGVEVNKGKKDIAFIKAFIDSVCLSSIEGQSLCK